MLLKHYGIAAATADGGPGGLPGLEQIPAPTFMEAWRTGEYNSVVTAAA